MPATVLGSAARYPHRGTSKVFWVPIASAPANGVMTTASLSATTTIDLTKAISALEGFALSQAKFDTPDWDTLITSQIPGNVTISDSAITFYIDKGDVDVRTSIKRLDTGYIVIAPTGVLVNKLVDVYPAEVMYSMKERADVARVKIPFAVGPGLVEDQKLAT